MEMVVDGLVDKIFLALTAALVSLRTAFSSPVMSALNFLRATARRSEKKGVNKPHPSRMVRAAARRTRRTPRRPFYPPLPPSLPNSFHVHTATGHAVGARGVTATRPGRHQARRAGRTRDAATYFLNSFAK